MLWLRSIIYYLIITLIALMIGAVHGTIWALGFALIVVAAALLFHLYNLGRLYQWAQQPRVENVPQSYLLWQDVFDKFYDQVRLQKKQQDRLANTLERFTSAGEALPDGVIILDEHDRIEWCNQAASLHLGIDRIADVWQVVTNILRQPSLREYLRTQDFAHPLQLRTTRPTEQVLSVQLVPFDSTRKLLLSRDITQLDRVQTVHRDFIANVSHELRTPLTVVGGFIETMIDIPDLDAATRSQQLQLMYEQTQRMQRLVEDLLTLSKLENGQQLREEEVDVPQLMRLLAAEAEGLSQGRHQIKIGSIAPARLIGNHDELHSAFGNLVSNAIRYTPAGGTITLHWRAEGEHGCFGVEDTGIGIAPEHIPRLTERFYRVDRGRSRATGGTGLGLAIVKHILQRHQAQMVIRSRLGEGSEFSVKFPAQRLLTD
ncbi:two-component system, OmpR family, phosphate regulon sensor histidine kinase PhoR [Andreprevotia lacus DSM 23236]|jgi:two-component system phosphate regulon sensor histidine kinase PhoR|uniref:Phosphate regulon sensor protein PhoR n=1 Tax=Andreprevotia lacus DSM 23236 TaxID=1121001 RepID=A0A1W1X1X6_9NEIS|nr:phosphate regulon sensor histidine kinase PhoR [Andreprevotia lacus]SMC17843.1 two-component system, OmpR family, phosphate regulon sensor histidine kinase PhoR [Andreprevotia lacus DSM 23236]